MEKDPIANDLRKALRERSLPDGAACVFCGESDPRTLDRHHPLGRNHSEAVDVVMCKNDHARCTDGQLSVGTDLRATSNTLERIMNALLSLGDFAIRLGKQLIEWAHELAAYIRNESPCLNCSAV